MLKLNLKNYRLRYVLIAQEVYISYEVFYIFHSVHFDSVVAVWPTNAHTSLEFQ